MMKESRAPVDKEVKDKNDASVTTFNQKFGTELFKNFASKNGLPFDEKNQKEFLADFDPLFSTQVESQVDE